MLKRAVFFLCVLSCISLNVPLLAAAGDVSLKDPKAKAAFDEGVAFGRQGKLKEAAADFEKVLKAEPGYAPAYNGLGISLANQGQHAEAIEKYKKAASLSPDMAKTYYNWGVSLMSLQKTAEAEKKFEKSAKLEPSFATYNAWGRALMSLGRYDDSVSKLKKAAELNPKEAPKIQQIIDSMKKPAQAGK